MTLGLSIGVSTGQKLFPMDRWSGCGHPLLKAVNNVGIARPCQLTLVLKNEIQHSLLDSQKMFLIERLVFVLVVTESLYLYNAYFEECISSLFCRQNDLAIQAVAICGFPCYLFACCQAIVLEKNLTVNEIIEAYKCFCWYGQLNYLWNNYTLDLIIFWCHNHICSGKVGWHSHPIPALTTNLFKYNRILFKNLLYLSSIPFQSNKKYSSFKLR